MPFDGMGCRFVFRPLTLRPLQSPYLWSLLTELAGPQGLYCDRVAQSALALLLHARRNQA